MLRIYSGNNPKNDKIFLSDVLTEVNRKYKDCSGQPKIIYLFISKVTRTLQCSMKPVKKTDRTIIFVEKSVMIVMEFCTVVVVGNPRQFVTAEIILSKIESIFMVPVVILCAKYYLCHPNEESIIISTNQKESSNLSLGLITRWPEWWCQRGRNYRLKALY